MKLDLTALLKNETDVIDISFEFEEMEIDYYGEIIEFKEPVKVSGSAKRISDEFFLEVEINVSITTHCARCLKEVSKPLSIKTFDELLPVSKENQIEQDENVFFYERHHIDLLAYSREQLLVNLPYKTVCREDCAGICTRCGRNLNVESCSCDHAVAEEDELDPRLAQLSEWFQKAKE